MNERAYVNMFMELYTNVYIRYTFARMYLIYIFIYMCIHVHMHVY